MESSPPSNNKPKPEEVARDKRALRLLLDTFRLEHEIELDRKLDESSTHRKIGMLISQGFVKTILRDGT
jgi:hypothetical protein